MVRQLDVYRHPQASRGGVFPYLVVLQHDRVPPQAGEVLAAPLAPRDRTTAERLLPVVDVEGRRYQLLVPMMRRVSVDRLETPLFTLLDSRDRIIAAIDVLFAGS